MLCFLLKKQKNQKIKKKRGIMLKNKEKGFMYPINFESKYILITSPLIIRGMICVNSFF